MTTTSALSLGNRRDIRASAWLLTAPAALYLAAFSIAPLALTLWFSMLRYRLLIPKAPHFIAFKNYASVVADPVFLGAIGRTLVLVGAVTSVSIVLGFLLALLLNRPLWGRPVVRLLAIMPFFVMPTVAALTWKNQLMDPVAGVFADLARFVGRMPIDWFSAYPLLAIIIILIWQWTPFAMLILLTSLQSTDQEQLDAARLDGAGALSLVRYIILPHVRRPIAVVALVETVFLLGVFAEILVTTAGGPGAASTNLTYLIYSQALLHFDVGAASAGGLIAVILANIIIALLFIPLSRSLDQ